MTLILCYYNIKWVLLSNIYYFIICALDLILIFSPSLVDLYLKKSYESGSSRAHPFGAKSCLTQCLRANIPLELVYALKHKFIEVSHKRTHKPLFGYCVLRLRFAFFFFIFFFFFFFFPSRFGKTRLLFNEQ